MNPTQETDLYLVIDESGSMHAQKKTLVNSVHELLQKQKKVGGACRVSLFFFNEEIREAYRHRSLEDVPMLTEDDYLPDCMTALRDAMGHVLDIISTESSSDMDQQKLVLLVVLTDGEENASMAVSSEELARKLEALERIKGQVVYVGSNQDAIMNGRYAGATRDSSLRYEDHYLTEAMDSLGNAVARCRSGATDVIRFTDLERGRSSGSSVLSSSPIASVETL
jgi:hypothetical protein